jgi:hypothetical protein
VDRIIFGDNQFFGVNHMSEEKARAQALKFRETSSILRVLDSALDCGIRTFMCTTHDRIAELCEHIRKDPTRYRHLLFYPCIPYAYKYGDAVTEYGMLGALQQFVAGTNILTLVARGTWAAATFDAVEIMKILVDAEMRMFKGLNTPIVFLQNVLVDLLLGIGYTEIFKEFETYVQKAYGAEAGFITMNLPRLLSALEQVGIRDPIICSDINRIGFRMCGGIEAYERLLEKNRFRPIAMSVFASGAIAASAAIEYVCRLPGVRSIVFGASSREHIQNTKQIIESYWSIPQA